MTWDTKLGWAQIVAISIFVLGYFVKWGIDVWEKRRDRKRFYEALTTEIRLNVTGLEQTITKFPPQETFVQFLSQGSEKRPHFISDYISTIFESNTSQLNSIPPLITKSIIEFYADLEFITKTVASFDKKSFETISQAGRERAVEQLRTKLALAAVKGRSLLILIDREHGMNVQSQ